MKRQDFMRIMRDKIFIFIFYYRLYYQFYIQNEVERKRKKTRGLIKYTGGHSSPAYESKINYLR